MGFQEELDRAVANERAVELKSLPVMTLGNLLEKLEAIEPTWTDFDGKTQQKHVYINFADLVPTTFASWRGVYAEVALGYGMSGYDGNDAKAPTLVDFIQEVKYAIGATYEGWKGGDFTMDKDTPVWIDNSGNYTNTMLVDVKHDKYGVTLVGMQKEEKY